jgi:hypothetical protein
MSLRDYNGRVIGMGVTAKPIMGHWANKEGLVIEIDDKVGNITLEFEDKEIGVYFNDRIIVC